MVNIAADCAAHVFVDILVSVIIDVAKGNTVPFLQVAESAGSGHVLEALAAIVTKHSVGNDCLEIGIAGADIKIQKPVIVQVPKVGAHRVQNVIKSGLAGNVGECAVVVVMIEARSLGVVRQTQVIGADVSDILDAVATDEKVIPAVVIVIKKPTRKTVKRFGDSGLSCDIGEFPDNLARRVSPDRTVIAE